MKNKKQLISLELIHKFVNVFSSFFLNIYLFKEAIKIGATKVTPNIGES